MPQIACPVCGFAYAASNITNHLRKAHKGIFVSQTAAATVGLVACTCGQVVLNAAALRKHQGIRKCQSAQSQPAACQRPVTQLVAANAAHTESAPAQLEAERYDPFIQALDPAIFADEQAMQLDSDSHPALTAEDSLDSVFAEAEATAEQVARAESLHGVEDAQVEIDFPDDASSGEVPDLSPISTPDLHAAEDGNHTPHVAVAVEEIQEVEEHCQTHGPTSPLGRVTHAYPTVPTALPQFPHDGSYRY